jgi:plasmid maintenance system antidote protein VapI
MAAATGRPGKLTPGAAALWDWMERRGLNQQEAAVILGIHYITLNQVLQMRRVPALTTAVLIERQTGIVPAVWARTGVNRGIDKTPEQARKRSA